MTNLLLRRAAAGLSLAAVAAAGLASVPTSAHAQMTDGWAYGNVDIDVDGPCESPGGGDWFEGEWTDNGAPHTAGTSDSVTATGAEGDVVDAASSYSSTITSTPLGAGPATVTGKVTSSASALSHQASTDCDVRADADGRAYGVFTLTQPMWVTLTVASESQRSGDSGGALMAGVGSIGEFGWPLPVRRAAAADETQAEMLMAAVGNRGSSSASTLLPPGEYAVATLSSTYAEASGDTEGSIAFTGTFKIDFQTPGTASAVLGKGASKVQFGARDCANGNVPVALSKKTVKKAKAVKFRVDGKKALTLKGKKLKGKKAKAKTVLLPSSPTARVTVKVKIKLENGRSMQATRSYLPCK
ncbi:hypothetical protein ACJ5H2_18800 [Nocardioides sp. R1-1]|uniref:hypothetical protein n=1 Tax=Nocardioides sp. R1-1 TaxID=3383502 RepID=UPI0038CF83E0